MSILREDQEQNKSAEKISQADIQKMLLQQLMQQKNAGGAQPKTNPIVRLANAALQKCEKSVYYIDRFINFVIKKHDPDRDDVIQSARAPIMFGGWVAFIFVIIGGIWSAVAPLDSAATAIGTVMVSSHKQVIQHPTGGVIKRIFVKQGDYVTENQPLIELDETQIISNYKTILNYYRNALANEARLIAERDNASEIEFNQLLLDEQHKPEVERIIHTQNVLFKSRQEAFNNSIENLMKGIEQTKKSDEAYLANKAALQKNIEFLENRLKSHQQLFKQGFAHKAGIEEIETKIASAQGQLAEIETNLIKNQQQVTRQESEIYSKKSEYLSNIIRELKENAGQLAEFEGKYISAKDALSRTVIKSPVEGIVNNLYEHHTIGAYIIGGHPVVEVTPYTDNLIIEAKVSQKDIDSLRVGLKAKIRFSAFKSRTTPVFTGTVVSLSPDIVQDPRGQQDPRGDTFYIARIDIDMDEFNKVAKERKLKLLPGMQAEVQIVRGTRTLLQYLLDPVTDNMFKAFKEK